MGCSQSAGANEDTFSDAAPTGSGDHQLNMGGIGLISLPVGISKQLLEVMILKLHSNQLMTLPEDFGKLLSPSLVELYLHQNLLVTLPESLAHLTGLTQLSLYQNKLTALPVSFGGLRSLVKLYLYSNQLSALPASFSLLDDLTTLHLYNNALTALPEDFGRLSSLTELLLQFNLLTTLPASFCQLFRLAELHVSDNQLVALPDGFGKLRSLSRLYLHNNQLPSLPETFSQLRDLSTLLLQQNQLTSLPENFCGLKGLQKLHLYGNLLCALPVGFGRISGLTDLLLMGNPLEHPPLRVCSEGVQAIGRYFAEHDEDGRSAAPLADDGYSVGVSTGVTGHADDGSAVLLPLARGPSSDESPPRQQRERSLGDEHPCASEPCAIEDARADSAPSGEVVGAPKERTQFHHQDMTVTTQAMTTSFALQSGERGGAEAPPPVSGHSEPLSVRESAQAVTPAMLAVVTPACDAAAATMARRPQSSDIDAAPAIPPQGHRVREAGAPGPRAATEPPRPPASRARKNDQLRTKLKQTPRPSKGSSDWVFM